MLCNTSKLESLLKKENIEIITLSNILIGSKEDVQLTADLANELRIDWVIADGYHFEAQCQPIIKEQELNL